MLCTSALGVTSELGLNNRTRLLPESRLSTPKETASDLGKRVLHPDLCRNTLSREQRSPDTPTTGRPGSPCFHLWGPHDTQPSQAERCLPLLGGVVVGGLPPQGAQPTGVHRAGARLQDEILSRPYRPGGGPGLSAGTTELS